MFQKLRKLADCGPEYLFLFKREVQYFFPLAVGQFSALPSTNDGPLQVRVPQLSLRESAGESHAPIIRLRDGYSDLLTQSVP